ncbi:response regulator [Kordiimonas lacus]|uniref:Hpt domain-containing protein n=1 Tax=Kordiimonas lacus TaxID=637679 RepID=A0A1G7AES9_9PROT|nr:response regulator [Kordiimonas lacus]SDE12957.1 Hpt domain-containing protein [Kordiimonas lacus]
MRDAALMSEEGHLSRQGPSAPLHALVVDDMPVMAKILGRTLDEMGITYDHVCNGAEALEAFEPGRFDMVFMDIMMPKMGGVEAARRLRALEQKAGKAPLPIIAVTTKMSGPENAVYMDAGMTDCIKKPVDRVSLEVMVKRHLTGEDADIEISDEYEDVSDEMEFVNWDTFREYGELLKGGMIGLIEDYLIAAPSLMEELSNAIEAKDCARVHMYASHFKSASVTFGAEKVAHLAAKIEIRSSKDRTEGLNQLYFDLHIAYEHTRQALSKKLIILKNF